MPRLEEVHLINGVGWDLSCDEMELSFPPTVKIVHMTSILSCLSLPSVLKLFQHVDCLRELHVIDRQLKVNPSDTFPGPEYALRSVLDMVGSNLTTLSINLNKISKELLEQVARQCIVLESYSLFLKDYSNFHFNYFNYLPLLKHVTLNCKSINYVNNLPILPSLTSLHLSYEILGSECIHKVLRQCHHIETLKLLKPFNDADPFGKNNVTLDLSSVVKLLAIPSLHCIDFSVVGPVQYSDLRKIRGFQRKWNGEFILPSESFKDEDVHLYGRTHANSRKEQQAIKLNENSDIDPFLARYRENLEKLNLLRCKESF